MEFSGSLVAAISSDAGEKLDERPGHAQERESAHSRNPAELAPDHATQHKLAEANPWRDLRRRGPHHDKYTKPDRVPVDRLHDSHVSAASYPPIVGWTPVQGLVKIVAHRPCKLGFNRVRQAIRLFLTF